MSKASTTTSKAKMTQRVLKSFSISAYLAFFLSGTSSLIFQTIWTRMLHHVFGATSVAISTVLTVFMAGLGLGAWLGGKFANRIKHPIIVYAVVEIGVGLWGLLVPLLVRPDGWLSVVNAFLRAELGAESSMFMVARFLCVLPILIIPTTLMGSTLPLLTRHFVSTDQDSESAGAKVGLLYAVNTFGAATGPLLSAFFLMPTIGLAATNVVACMMNFSLAAIIWFSRKTLLQGRWIPGEPLEIWPKSDAGDVAEATESPPEAQTESEETIPDEDGASESPGNDNAPPVPELARKAAFFVFAASGAAALAYEVVWSRALAMTIGSSIYSFALILETFLIGIALGSAAMSSFMGKKAKPLLGLAVVSVAMVLLSNVPWAINMVDQANDRTIEGSWGSYAIICALFSAPIVLTAIAAYRRLAAPQAAFDAQTGAWRVVPALIMVLTPVSSALLNLREFPGHLPMIIGSVVGAVGVFLLLTILLSRRPVLLLALIQLYIAGATVVSYIWQDEIPFAFAQLVVSIPTELLADHVGSVKVFMWLTVVLCTLPATLGMGAMFPLTVRLWTSGGNNIAKDVASVYAGNTLGSIIGAWLPGFVLFGLIGAERTLHVGIVVNMVLALVMLIAGAADSPERGAEKTEGKDGESMEKARPSGELPLWHAITVYLLSPAIPALIALLYLGTQHTDSPLRWNRAQMTLGVFRVSLANNMLDPGSWGQPDLVYYRDGLTTTVSVERWGRHYALKNNGKVDASNGDDMPTQINVAAYPLLLHRDGPEGLDVAVVGFGSGVSVGTALQFPVARVDVIELERAIPEAARFFEDVSLLDYRLDEWPYVEMDRLTVINDDGRNYLASTRQEYDVIISEPSNPWITGVSDLFTVDHWRITQQRLRPGGIYCQWVQLYELSPENIKTIYRTFASQFEHVLVLSADDRSSDTVLIGSNEPLSLDLERVRAAYDLEGVRAQLERANLYSPFDVFARTLLASREEVMAFTQIEERRRGTESTLFGEQPHWEVLDNSNNDTPCEAPSCRRRPATLNTDDNARIEFAAPNDLIGFARYEGYLGRLYSEQWPYGEPTEALANFGEGDEAARNYAELALSMIGHGRYGWAGNFIERSQRAGRARETAVALEVLTHLLTSDNEPSIAVEAPIPGPEMDADAARRLNDGFDNVRDAVDEQAYGAALAAMENIPQALRLHSGPGLRFLYAYLLYKAANGSFAQFRTSIEHLDDLVRTEPDFVLRHPAVYYFLARAHDADGDYAHALQSMRAYVEARLVPVNHDSEDVPEPAQGTVTTSDAPGESDKLEHPERH